MSGGFTFGASTDVRKSSRLGGRAEYAVFQDGTPGFRSEMPGREGACVVPLRGAYLSIPYSFSLRQWVVRPIPRDSAVRE